MSSQVVAHERGVNDKTLKVDSSAVIAVLV